MQLTTRFGGLEQGFRHGLPTIPYQPPITQGYIWRFYFH